MDGEAGEREGSEDDEQHHSSHTDLREWGRWEIAGGGLGASPDATARRSYRRRIKMGNGILSRL
jgi:hypothetical protein